MLAALNVTVEVPVPEKVMLPLLATLDPLSVKLLGALSRMFVTLLPMVSLIVDFGFASLICVHLRNFTLHFNLLSSEQTPILLA